VSRRAAAFVIAGWGLWNLWLIAIIIPFGQPTEFERFGIYLSSESFLAIAALSVWQLRKHPRRPAGTTTRSGGPALAMALAVMFAGLAWTFGVFLAYFCIPLVGYSLGKWRSERQAEEEMEEAA
jgi:hypothetical protein